MRSRRARGCRGAPARPAGGGRARGELTLLVVICICFYCLSLILGAITSRAILYATAGYRPGRKQARADTGPTKSHAGCRVVGLPEPLIVLLKVHRERRDAEHTAARQLWHGEGWVFAKPDGRPLNPTTTSGRH